MDMGQARGQGHALGTWGRDMGYALLLTLAEAACGGKMPVYVGYVRGKGFIAR